MNGFTRYAIAATLWSTFLLTPEAVRAQNEPAPPPTPLSDFVLTGYGTSGYQAMLEGASQNDFSASVSPVILYHMGSDFLFESELEFGFEGGATTTALEYAQIDYLGFERLQIVGGKFLLPFGLFSERLHPSWINRLPSMPLLYGHAHGGVAEGSLLPVLSDAGLMLRYKLPFTSGLALDASAWATQGPRLVASGEADDHEEADGGHAHSRPSAALRAGPLDEGHGDGESDAAAIEVPAVAFGVAFGDNNDNKMLGARVGLVSGGAFEVYLSGFHAMYDPEDFLDIVGGNLSLEARRGAVELKGEATLLRQEFALGDEFRTLNQAGYYAQFSRRFGALEPVVRWSHLLKADVDGMVARANRRQLALGLTYWLQPSVPVKIAYHWEADGRDGLALQWAFGF